MLHEKMLREFVRCEVKQDLELMRKKIRIRINLAINTRSVLDPFHFDMAPDPRIRFDSLKRIQIP